VETSERTGHHVLLFSGDEDDPLDGYDELLRSTAVDAFVVTDTFAGTPQAAFLQSRGAPFVAFGRPWDDVDDESGADWAWVDVDGAHGARLATEHLLEQGHSRIAWLGWERSSRIGQDRRSGWESAMRDAGLDVAGLGIRTTDNVDAARLAVHRVLDDRSLTGFVCVSDTLGIGALHALQERGLVPGRDVGVVGFDDSLGAQMTWPGLSSVRQPLEQVAVELVTLLHLVLGDKPIGEKGTMLQPALVVRRSSRRDWD
jgi:LacI family transcriptional regulator